MSGFWDNWAYAYRNTRAWSAAIALLCVLLFLWIYEPDQPVSVIETSGEVLEVHELAATRSRYGAGSTYIGLVRLEDGGETRIYLRQPIPKPGTRVPLRVEVYPDGERRAALDVVQWQGF